MPVTEDDLDAWARRVGTHFEPSLRGTAESIASLLIRLTGTRPKDLRPETPMRQVIAWLKQMEGSTSLDWVEVLMAIEEETKSELVDAFAEKVEDRTFGEVVKHLYEQRRVA